MLILDSVMVDNSAEKYTHGLSMISSTVEVSGSSISFSEEFAENLDVQYVEVGFFKLMLSSNLTISDETEIRNLRASNMGVVAALSLSSVYIRNGVRFLNNSALSQHGQTIFMQKVSM